MFQISHLASRHFSPLKICAFARKHNIWQGSPKRLAANKTELEKKNKLHDLHLDVDAAGKKQYEAMTPPKK